MTCRELLQRVRFTGHAAIPQSALIRSPRLCWSSAFAAEVAREFFKKDAGCPADVCRTSALVRKMLCSALPMDAATLDDRSASRSDSEPGLALVMVEIVTDNFDRAWWRNITAALAND